MLTVKIPHILIFQVQYFLRVPLLFLVPFHSMDSPTTPLQCSGKARGLCRDWGYFLSSLLEAVSRGSASGGV
jgi:hypothetical protein